jgi:hypothetical protein
MSEENDNIQFLGDVRKTEEDQGMELSRLKVLSDSYLAIEEEVKTMEAMLKEKKEIFRQLSQEEIPNFLQQFNLSSIQLESGEKITVKPDVSCSVTDYAKFIDFLKGREEDGIVKLTIAFDRMESDKQKELFNFLNEEQYLFGSDNKVHSQTMKKYFKELLGVGMTEEERVNAIANAQCVNSSSVEDFAKVFQYYKTTIKK